MKLGGIRRGAFALAALGCSIVVVGSLGMPTAADAAGNFYAFYKIKISDTRNTEDFFVERRSVRSWGSIETCKSESAKPEYADRQIWAVRSLNIVTSRGTLPQLSMHSIECREG